MGLGGVLCLGPYIGLGTQQCSLVGLEWFVLVLAVVWQGDCTAFVPVLAVVWQGDFMAFVLMLAVVWQGDCTTFVPMLTAV